MPVKRCVVKPEPCIRTLLHLDSLIWGQADTQQATASSYYHVSAQKLSRLSWLGAGFFAAFVA